MTADDDTSDVDVDLDRFTADVGRVLAVVAHPDDLEYGAAAAIAKWTELGHDVAYVLATRGEAGIDGMSPDECGPVRAAEQRASAAVVGVEEVEFLDLADGVLVADLALRRSLTSVIRRVRPDTVITLNHRPDWGAPGTRNSADHRALGEALLDAIADASNRWVFAGVGGPAHRVRRAMIASSPQARHAVEVDERHVDLAVASLAEHRAYLDGLGDHAMADPEFVRWQLHASGARCGCDAALAVELFTFG
ncbi:MAG: PIG-L deacetylase family protein [Nitriliruptoraceae bacterium]